MAERSRLRRAQARRHPARARRGSAGRRARRRRHRAQRRAAARAPAVAQRLAARRRSISQTALGARAAAARRARGRAGRTSSRSCSPTIRGRGFARVSQRVAGGRLPARPRRALDDAGGADRRHGARHRRGRRAAGRDGSAASGAASSPATSACGAADDAARRHRQHAHQVGDARARPAREPRQRRASRRARCRASRRSRRRCRRSRASSRPTSRATPSPQRARSAASRHDRARRSSSSRRRPSASACAARTRTRAGSASTVGSPCSPRTTRPHGAACVIDAGTAVTFDAVDARRRASRRPDHARGAAARGRARSQHEQHRRARRRRRPSRAGSSCSAATPMRPSATARGSRSRRRSIAPSATVARALGTTPVVYLTGGDADALRGWLETESNCGQTWCSRGWRLFAGVRSGGRSLMRNLFLALVLANLAFAAWSAWFAPAQRAGRRADDGLPALTLVSEVPPICAVAASSSRLQRPSKRPAIRRAPSQRSRRAAGRETLPCRRRRPAGSSPRARCSRSRCGALHERRTVSRAVASRDGGGDAAHGRLSTAAARRRRRHLDRLLGLHRGDPDRAGKRTRSSRRSAPRASRIRTSFPTATAATSSRSASSARSAASAGGAMQVRALGFEPEVVDRTRRATVYWVDVMLAPEQTLDFDALQPPGRIIRLEQRSCEPRRAERQKLKSRILQRARVAAACSRLALWFSRDLPARPLEEQDMRLMKPTTWTLGAWRARQPALLRSRRHKTSKRRACGRRSRRRPGPPRTRSATRPASRSRRCSSSG